MDDQKYYSSFIETSSILIQNSNNEFEKEALISLLNELYSIICAINEGNHFFSLSRSLQGLVIRVREDLKVRINSKDLYDAKDGESSNFIKKNLIEINNKIISEVFGEVPLNDFECLDLIDIDH